MPGFFNALTQAAASYLKLLEVDPLINISEGQEAASIPSTPNPNQPVLDYISDAKNRFESFFSKASARITNLPGQIERLKKFPKGSAFNNLFKALYGDSYRSGDITSELSKILYKDLKRPKIIEGRIVGKYSKTYLMLAFLSEFLKPREGIDLSAYFRNPIDPQTLKVITGIHLSEADVGIAAPLSAGVLVQKIRTEPEYFERVATGLQNVGEVDRARFQTAAQDYILKARARMRGVTEDLAAGRITFRGYRQAMIGEIKRVVLAEVILGIGGVGNLTDEVLDNVHQRIRQDIRALDHFIEDLKMRGRENDDLFSSDSAIIIEPIPNTELESIPTQTLESAVTNLAATDFTTNYVADDSYAGVGSITGEDFETAGKFSEAAYEAGQEAFRTILADNANENNLFEVRRLDQGSDNCEFCISWADKPMPPGELPPIGDPGCLGVRYGTAPCHCTMDTATQEEIEQAKDDS